MLIRFRPSASRQRGVTLIEVLTALAVLTIGLLGLAGLQAIGLRSQHGAYLKSQAALATQDILERMRANPGAPASGYAIDSLASAEAADCETAPCTPAQIQSFDLWEWKKILARLPGGDGAISVQDNQVTIAVYWLEHRREGATPVTFSVHTEL